MIQIKSDGELLPCKLRLPRKWEFRRSVHYLKPGLKSFIDAKALGSTLGMGME
jgi:hypothetical protein